MKTFYRVCHVDTQQGLWYDEKGNFTGLIHNKFNFCTNSSLEMDFDNELVGWLSAADSLDALWNWFSKDDIYQLQKYGWCIHVYETTDYRFYERFQHYVINQNNIKLVDVIKI